VGGIYEQLSERLGDLAPMDTTPAQPTPLSRSVTISNHPASKSVTIAPRAYTASYSITPKERLNVITLHSTAQNHGVFSS
jgi:hypothetical protein